MITGIGSLPFKDVDEAIDLIFSTCPEIPFWPQLPKRSKKEGMYVPFMEGVPFFRTSEDGSVYVDEDCAFTSEEFESLMEGKGIEIPPDLIPGFYRILERLKEIEPVVKAIKTQITGPISMGLGIKDRKGIPVIYDDFLFSVVKKAINMKAKWMVQEIRRHFPEKDVIIFFDEPYLVAYGSVYFSLPKEHVVDSIGEVIKDLDAKKGIHCCGNTDWSVVLKAGVEIVNYDAFNYLESIFLYSDDLVHFFKNNGILSPGLIPSTEDVKKTTNEDVKRILVEFVRKVHDVKGKLILDEILITHSCGLGSLDVKDAKRAMELLKEVPDMVFEIFDKEAPSW